MSLARIRLPVVAAATCAASLSACGGGPVVVRQPAAMALRSAEARLAERGIAIDPNGRTPESFRTERFCYVPPDAQGNSWDRSFIAPYRGLLTPTVEGDAAEQGAGRGKCSALFRVELRATTDSSGQARLQATSEWWRLAQRRCEVLGNPLLGRMRCEYGYDGALAPQSVEPHIHAMLTGL